MTTSRLPRLRLSPLACLSWAVMGVCAADLLARQLMRQPLLQLLGGRRAPELGFVVAVAAVAALVEMARLRWTRRPGAPGLSRVSRSVVVLLALAFVGGLAAQQRVGARLQSDGFYYYAFLRSLANDHDVSLANDYQLLGITHAELFTPTPTGYAQTAWSVGPAIVWSPFYALGGLAARYLASTGATVSLDGTSFPYRQAICVASLFYGLLGFWFCYRLAARVFAEAVAALAMAAMALGSFMLWYLVKEPTMSHATSMAIVAGFLYAWVATRGSRAAWQYAALGLLAGLMLAVRWQNAIFLLAPAWEFGWSLWRPADGRSRRVVATHAATFAGLMVIGFLPQLLAWNAIYGSPVAVSPLSPKMYWSHPDIVGLLWSSRNGLFASSPVTYLAAIGLLLWGLRDRAYGWPALAMFCAAVYVNASVEDWWGGSSFGMRRFDGSIPLLVVGLAACIDLLQRWIARRPLAAAGALLALLVLWNVTALKVALDGRYGGSVPQSFVDLSREQAQTAARWFGHPFSYPFNLIYSVREGVAPFRYDYFAFPMLGDPAQPYGRVDVGGHDEMYLTDGWYDAETLADGTTLRWTGATAEVLVPLDHPAALMLQLRVKGFWYPSASSPQLAVRVNGRSFGPFTLTGDWQRLDFPTDAGSWRAGVNHVQLVWLNAAVPDRVGVAGGDRELGGAVDYVRVQVQK